MRNLLTMVSAVASMSLRHARDIEDARASIAQRLSALSRNQSLLLADGEGEASIQELLDQALAPHPQLHDRMKISGPDLRLNSKLAIALALALNELITNAIKYGALSHPDGAITVTWDPAVFSFRWQETGISYAEKPSREGFGTRVLMRFVATSFSGDARRHFGNDGFIYELTAPPQVVGTSA